MMIYTPSFPESTYATFCYFPPEMRMIDFCGSDHFMMTYHHCTMMTVATSTTSLPSSLSLWEKKNALLLATRKNTTKKSQLLQSC